MISRKRINLISALAIVTFSVFAIIASNSPSKFSSPFEKEEVTLHEPENVYEEEVLGQSVLVSENPSLTSAPDETDEENSIDTQSEQIDEDGYKVVKVVDGDTLDVDIDGRKERLRLIGIDTPETVDPRKSVQCFGKEASSKAKEMLLGQFVSLESDDTQGERDKYKRLLRYVFLPDGTNFNLYMISEGYAHEYTYDQPYKYQAEFKQAEATARENSKGLWNPTVCP